MVISQENVQFGVIRRNKSSLNPMDNFYSATSKSHHSLLSTPAYYKIWPNISHCKIVQEDNWLSSQEIKILMQNDILQNKNVLRN